MKRALIYDVGAHEGEDTDFYLKKGFHVVAVEANPMLADGLRTRFAAEIASGRLRVVEAAVAEREGPVEFFINERTSVWGTIRPQWAERNERMGASSSAITVPARRFADIMSEHGTPYYLKVDIEGADMLCLEGLRELRDRPRFVSIESEKRQWRDLRAEFDLLSALGYRRFQVVEQSSIERQCVPKPPREGRDVDHRFPPGASGLFGEELPGEWISASAALATYRRAFLRYRIVGDATIGARIASHVPGFRRYAKPRWYDTHARRD